MNLSLSLLFFFLLSLFFVVVGLCVYSLLLPFRICRVMFRRVALKALTASTAARFYTPSADLVKLYDSDFARASFPTNIVPSDSVLFAKFLYKAAEQKNIFEKVLQDFETIAAAVPKLPVFWERTVVVQDVKEFKGLQEATSFTLQWMQSNGMLDLLPDVAEVYETYVNAKLKRVSVKVYVAPGKTGDNATIAEAKKIAESTLKDSKEYAGLKPHFKVLVDRTIVEGFTVDIQGIFVNKAKGRQVASSESASDADYTNIPLMHGRKTSWEDNIETQVLRQYLDKLSEYDAEEMVSGV
ncbi:hypothetical protein STCU_02147 [Strigomonas culicis]|uniref:Uncharacterized protein n=1 Tax=Strigomonas culicis TaxID=28005 RepID=S9WBY1_9TRYP|nr:hypothetical protein STCU_02147 [Strigomonas culicis]|eukprot:EPY33580.1 hypothetical protein STCU_02147 [Strigomonas culicis]